MANLKKAVNIRMATEVKTLLWQGVSQAKVAILVGVSQSVVSRIKDGIVVPEAPWPSGATGAMPLRGGLAKEEGWSDPAAEFMKMPEEMQLRIISMVNEARRQRGDPEIPVMAEEYERLMKMDPTDRAFEPDAIPEARLAEDRRMAMLMLEFNELLAERRASYDDTTIQRIIDSTLPAFPDDDLPQAEQAKELVYSKMPWPMVCQRAFKVRVVQQALISDRVAFKEACCIVFHALSGSRQSWNDEAVALQISALADKLEQYPTILERLVEEYRSVPVWDGSGVDN